MSTVPTSYPGNIILTEDLAEFANKNKCKDAKGIMEKDLKFMVEQKILKLGVVQIFNGYF